MSQWDKLLGKVRNLSPHLRFEEFYSPITIPKHKPIKKIYIEMVREVVEREEAAYANN